MTRVSADRVGLDKLELDMSQVAKVEASIEILVYKLNPKNDHML